MAYRVIGRVTPLEPEPIAEGESVPEALVSVSDLRKHSRLDDTAEDDDLAMKLDAAIAAIEGETQRTIRSARFLLTATCFPYCGEPILLPAPPLMELESIKYYDADGELQTLRDLNASPQVEGDITIIHTKEYAQVHLNPEATWPQTQTRVNAVQITLTAGYDELPADLAQAVLKLAAHMYEFREVGCPDLGTLDPEYAKIIDRYRISEYTL